jgi:hypothetical protein
VRALRTCAVLCAPVLSFPQSEAASLHPSVLTLRNGVGQTPLWSSLTQHLYSFPPTTTTFAEAHRLSTEATFAGVKGHLFTPNSHLEYAAVLTHLMWKVHRNSIWMAVSDQQVEDKWVFTAGPETGIDVSDLLWWTNKRGGRQQNCLSNWPNLDLEDDDCDQPLKFIIEFECPFGQTFNGQNTACIGKAVENCSCKLDEFGLSCLLLR